MPVGHIGSHNMGINMETMDKQRLFFFPNLIEFDIMEAIFLSPIRCSPLPQLSLGNNDLSGVEEGKFSPPQESTEDIVVGAPTIAPKVSKLIFFPPYNFHIWIDTNLWGILHAESLY